MENSKENMHFYIRAERVKGRTCEYIDAPLPGPMSIFFESVFFFFSEVKRIGNIVFLEALVM